MEHHWKFWGAPMWHFDPRFVPALPEPPKELEKPAYFAGLDLGQAQDFTALAVVERTRGPNSNPNRPDTRKCRFNVRHLHRWPLGTVFSVRRFSLPGDN